MHCDWPIDFYEDCASPPSEMVLQFLDIMNDAPDYDPIFIHVATQTFEPSHDSDQLSNVTTDLSDDENLLENLEDILYATELENVYYGELSDSASTTGSSCSLAMSGAETVHSESDLLEISEDDQTTSSVVSLVFSNEDNISIDGETEHYGSDFLQVSEGDQSSSSLLSFNISNEDNISISQLSDITVDNNYEENDVAHNSNEPLSLVCREESICSAQNLFNEQNVPPQEISNDYNSTDHGKEDIFYVEDSPNDVALSTEQYASSDENRPFLSVSDQSVTKKNVSEYTELIKISSPSSKFSSILLSKPSTSKYNNEITSNGECVKSYNDVPSTSEMEKSDSQTLCDIMIKEENNEQSRMFQSKLLGDHSNCMKSNPVLESNDNSYQGDSTLEMDKSDSQTLCDMIKEENNEQSRMLQSKLLESNDNSYQEDSTSEMEKSDSQTLCDIVIKEENNEQSRTLQSKLLPDHSNCMASNSVLEGNSNSYQEDSMISSSLTSNINVAEVGAGSSSESDKLVSKLKHKIDIDSKDIIPNKVPKYVSEAVSVSNDKFIDQ